VTDVSDVKAHFRYSFGVTSRERMQSAMRLDAADRVPVMCQLSLGHYFLNSGVDAIDIWYSSEGFAEALIRMQQRYGFDGILINLPGRDRRWSSFISRIERREGERWIHWENGFYSVFPDADLPHVFRPDGSRFFAQLENVDPEQLYYIEPHDLAGVKYPYAWGIKEEPAPHGREFFPPWHCDTIKAVLARVGDEVSVHGEIFSPFSQVMDLFDVTPALLSIRRQPSKLKDCLAALTAGTIELGKLQAAAGAHAILISSAFAGASFLGRKQYEEFVLPFERDVIREIKQEFDIPIYTHTCGDIGDRLDLMEQTGTNGIDTLDPPPLGTVELADAKRQTAGRLFLKGNLDSVALMQGTPDDAFAAARGRIEVGAPGGGYILSTACSVAPGTPPENIEMLREAAEKFGTY
jgi:uroporphyrinogen-III decarboxylase